MRGRSKVLGAVLAAVLVVVGCAASGVSNAATGQTIFGTSTSGINTDPDTSKSVIGTQFRVAKAGTVDAIKVHRSTHVTGDLTGKVARGSTVLATVTLPAAGAGWQVVDLPSPVDVVTGQTYTVFYTAPAGRYSVKSQSSWPRVSGDLTAVKGVYTFGSGVPTSVYNNENYFVDVVFNPTVVVPPTTSASPSPTTTAPTTTSEPPVTTTSEPTTPPATTIEPTTTAPTTTTAPPGGSILDLPRIPWEGAEYWKQFPNADAGGWDDPSFFPVGCWFCNVSSASEIAFDKSKGINTYLGMWEGTDFNLFPESNVYWLGVGLKNQDNNSPYNPGVFLDDEADGTYSPPSAGQQHLADVKATVGPNRFAYANFTQLVVGGDMALSDQLKFVNDYTDAVSVDMYWYSVPFCDWTPYRGNMYAVPVPQETCRTAHSYGLTNEALRLRDASDGKLQPTWTWVENFNGLSGQSPRPYTTPAQIKGAAMSTIIHEARGLFWFNQSFTGDCQTSNVIRQAQVDPNSTCGSQYRANIDAMGDVNNLVHSLAPVINTQSYQWSFGDGLDTMLKVKDGSAYVFAMTEGTSGDRTFTLPAGVTGATVEVVGEGRTIPVSSGSFSDTFAAESTYHVYRIAL